MITEKNVVRHELIGLRAKITESKDPSQKSIKGTIVDETRNMLAIRQGEKIKNVEKKNCIFEIELPDGKKVEVNGKVLVGRPAERIKKKLPKKWSEIGD